jgi:hypothetical protein
MKQQIRCMMRLLLITLAMAWFATQGFTQEPPPFTTVAARYLTAQSYCDSGIRRWNDAPQGQRFQRCAVRDGRFKLVNHPGERGEETIWSDAVRYYRFFNYNSLYQVYELNSHETYQLYVNIKENFAVFVFREFVGEPYRLVKPEERNAYLAEFRFNAELSNAERWVYDRLLPNRPDTGERIWVRADLKNIARAESLQSGKVMRSVDFGEPQFDRALTQDDLEYDLHFYHRVAPQNNKIAFMAIVATVLFLLGVAFWYWRYARATYLVDVSEARGRWWRRLIWTASVTAAVLLLLAVATWGGSGHPPAIAYVWVFSIFCALGFALVATFIIASYPAQWIAKRRRTYPDAKNQSGTMT